MNNIKKQKSKEKDQKDVKDPEFDQEMIDYKDKYLRSLADYQNLIKRTQNEKEEFYKYAHESFVEKLLPVLDNLERADKNTQDTGIALVFKELRKILEELGLEKIIIKESDKFNPEYMKCIEAEDGGNKLVETQAGYKFKGRFIQPVQVKVVK